MLDPVINLFSKLFELIGRGIGYVIAWILWPFITFRNWLRGKGWFVKIPVFLILVLIFLSYAYLIAITQVWSIGDERYAKTYSIENNQAGAGEELGNNKCQPSAMVQVSSDLIDKNVNQGTWSVSYTHLTLPTICSV